MRIETVAMRVPLDRVYKGSHYRMTHRSTIITRVHTASGIIGEAYAGDEDAGLEEIDGIIRNEIEPVLIGQDAFSTELCWALARPATWNILRDRRLGLVATACVDVAIWDAVGKVLSMPLHKLWGGYRTSVPVITIGGYYAEDANISVEVNGLVEAGFAGMKFKIGGLTPEEDAVRFRKARETAGPDFKLAVDANQGWTPAQAIKFTQLVDDCDIMWFEEPCVWQNDRRAMRDVRLAGGVPVCTGVRRCAPARASSQPPDAATSWRPVRSTSSTSTHPGRAAPPSGAVPPPSRPSTTCGWRTTRNRKLRLISWRQSRTAPILSTSTRSATRSGTT